MYLVFKYKKKYLVPSSASFIVRSTVYEFVSVKRIRKDIPITLYSLMEPIGHVLPKFGF